MAASANHALPAERGGSVAPLVGIGLITLACFCFAVLDATAKYLGQSLPTLQIVWVRFATHVIFALILFRVWNTPSALLTKRPLLQFARSLCLLGTTLCNFLALQHLQLAETMSIFFAAPFVVTALAGPMLGEWAGRRRWAAILVGFSGVLIVTQPGLGTMHWAVTYSVGAMFLSAVYSLLTRQLTATESTAGLVIISGLTAAVAMTPAGLADWTTPPDLFHWGLLLSTGLWGSVGHWLFIQAHRVAPATVLAPFIYIQIVWMVTLGYIVFDDIPAINTFVGASVVVASGLYLLYRERRRPL